MYIEAFQHLDNEPYQPDTSISHVQSIKNTISEHLNVILNNLCLIHKLDKSKLNHSTIESIFKNNNATKIQYVSNLIYLINNLDSVLSTIKNDDKELVLTDTNSNDFGVYIKSDVNFHDKLFVHICNNILTNAYWQSTIQWIEV